MSNRTSTMKGRIFDFKVLGSVNALVKIAILSVLAYIIMLIEIPVFFFPGFLQIDFSDLPALIGGFALGPAAGIMIELVKNLLHFITKTNTGGVGEFANFLVGVALILPSTAIYIKYKTKKAAMLGMLLGIVCIAMVGAVTNYYILLPFYAKVMPLDQIIAFSSAANPAIKDIKTLILYGVIPFNIFKGILVTILTSILYKKLSPIIKVK